VLAGGVLVASTASILIRLAQAEGVPSLTIAAMRLGLAALILLPVAWPHLRTDLPGLPGRHLRLALISGACLAVHFWSWITSLAYTSVASSTVLVTTNPIWVGLASMLLLRERPAAAGIVGIVLSVAGTALIFATDSQTTATYAAPGLGNGLALVGAISASAYLLLGRALRTHFGLLGYIWLAYATAAAVLWIGVVVSGAAVLGFSVFAYLMLLALAIGPQLLGHTAFNWSLRHLSATFVALSILGEPVGSAVLAYFMFDEKLSALQLAGFLLILVGIFVAARAERKAQPN
jgi:drug/metabolite transporter (DMT)-like permease